jgi:acyl-CoA synthetase (AMP-forming)/AMP-acid ligase II
MLASVPMLIGDVFRRNAEVVPDRIAASLGAATLSHAELDRAGNRLCRALTELGVRRGDRVVSWADTSLEVLPLFVALAKLGAVFAPLNARLGADEAADVVRPARARLLVTDPPRAEAGGRVAIEAGVPTTAQLAGDGPGSDLASASRGQSDAEPPAAGLSEDDPHVLFFTSGSTGRPKGVVLSHRVDHLRTFQGVFRDDPERSVCMFPLFHMAAFTLALCAWQTRGEIAFVEAATAESLLDAVQRRRANRLYCIPAVWARILETDPGKWDTSSLREVDTGTSATPIELIRALKQRFPGTATRVYYGSTEAGSAATLPDADVLRKPGSVGPPAPGVDLRLADDGEICVRSPFLMDGYFDDPEASAEALAGGWFHTGDLGAFDEEGYLAIVGRKKELIRTGGEAVAPAEVEAVLADHPGIAEVAVVGLPDARWGEIVCAVVVLEPGAHPTLEERQRHCDSRLAAFKKPRRLERVEALPRTTATGQVQRALLIEQLQVAGEPDWE